MSFIIRTVHKPEEKAHIAQKALSRTPVFSNQPPWPVPGCEVGQQGRWRHGTGALPRSPALDHGSAGARCGPRGRSAIDGRTAGRVHGLCRSTEIRKEHDNGNGNGAGRGCRRGCAGSCSRCSGSQQNATSHTSDRRRRYRGEGDEVGHRVAGEAADTPTKRVAGENLTSDAFAYVGDKAKTDTWKLPYKFS